jgi:tryptophan synthase beta chain
MESHSVSAGLDYAGVGPELASLVESGHVWAVNVDDDAALEAFHRLSRLEGIIPALETAHAFGYIERVAGSQNSITDGPSGTPRDETHDDLGDTVVVNVSGRGDKDLDTVIEETERREIDDAQEMDVFE